jgi:hypothetical protein
VRYYMIDREEVEGFPTLFVVGEVICWAPEANGRRHAFMEHAEISETELRAMPGGSAALLRWTNGDDEPFEQKAESAGDANRREEERIDSLPPLDRWEHEIDRLMRNGMTREQAEYFWGPRPTNLEAV